MGVVAQEINLLLAGRNGEEIDLARKAWVLITLLMRMMAMNDLLNLAEQQEFLLGEIEGRKTRVTNQLNTFGFLPSRTKEVMNDLLTCQWAIINSAVNYNTQVVFIKEQ